MTRLGDVCEKRIDTIKATYTGDIDYIDISSIDNKSKKITEIQSISIVDAPSRAKQLVFPGDILVSTVRPNLNAVALVTESADNTLVASTGYCVLRCLPNTYNKYVFYFCQSPAFIEKMVTQATGASYPAVTSSIVKECTIPLPSLEEQRRIAALLDKVIDLIAKRRAQLDKLDLLVKARFVEMFGDPEENPREYEKRKLGSLARKISDGVHAKPEYTETGRPFLSVVNINKGIINFEGCKFVSEEAYQKMIKSTHPERGDILYTKVGATYGIPAYVDTDTEFCLYVSVCLIKPRHDEIDSKFLALSMSMPYIKRQADGRIKGIGVPDLHLNQISEFDILCPPRSEQEAFVDFAAHIDKSKLMIQQSLDRLEILKKALMQQYFG